LLVGPLATTASPLGDPNGAYPAVRDTFAYTKDVVVQLCLDNIGWFVAVFTFYLAVRFAPALLSWYRHRNDPKQLSLF